MNSQDKILMKNVQKEVDYLESDAAKWGYLMYNKHYNTVIMLDNDQTMAFIRFGKVDTVHDIWDRDESIEIRFDNSVGYMPGVTTLLSSIGLYSEHC